jgi:hypothetical protein
LSWLYNGEWLSRELDLIFKTKNKIKKTLCFQAGETIVWSVGTKRWSFPDVDRI